jgi:hypothetical protein
MRNNPGKIIVSALLLAFGFSMQSFIGLRIEKRHYRKGYYVHIWRNPKTQPVRATTKKVVVKEEKQAGKPPAMQESRHDDEPQRNAAPVSRAIDN